MTIVAADQPSQASEPSVYSVDGRQSVRATEIARGAQRLLARHGMPAIAELPLANGRRADLIAISASGEVWIVEIKSSIEDFRADQKWPEYRAFCDRLFFAVMADFPTDILPLDTGMIVADRYGGELLRSAPEHRLAGARRKALMLRFARTAAGRLMQAADPEQVFEAGPRE